MENTTMNNDGIDFAGAKSAADKILDGVLDSSKQVANLCRAYLALEKEKADKELDAVAPGHNPDKVTIRQLEADKGWRLLEIGEIDDERDITQDIRGWMGEKMVWTYQDGGHNSLRTYRTRKPKGYYLPKPKPKLVPFTAETFPKGEVWVRRECWNDGNRHLVRAVLDYGVYTIREDQMLPYTAEGFQHSLDGGRTWLPWGTLEGGAK